MALINIITDFSDEDLETKKLENFIGGLNEERVAFGIYNLAGEYMKKVAYNKTLKALSKRAERFECNEICVRDFKFEENDFSVKCYLVADIYNRKI
jgi:hypothetical protein